jgi:putative glutamine amidotransferase
MTIPLIGVTTSRLKTKYGFLAFSVAEKYVLSLADAGAAPVLLPLGLPEDRLQVIFERLDGILFTGGGDIHPGRFGAPLDELSNQIDEDRDRVELHLLQRAFDRSLPLMGICRGFQLLNIGLGGTLYTDIKAQHAGALRHDYYPDLPRDYLAHPVQIVPGTRLHAILGTKQLKVNSLHHQGIKILASRLVPSAVSPDGIIEGVEMKEYPFGLAVQWHPEWLQAYQPMQELFRAFVQACAA